MAAENWEKLNPGSVVNWGQVEMIYDLRNALTLYTIIQTTVSVGLSNLWNQIEIGIFQKMSGSRGKTHGRGQAGGQMRLYLNTKPATFSSHTHNQSASKSWFIVIQRRDGIGLCQGNFICLESDRKIKKGWKFLRKLGFVPVTVSLCSLSQLVLASQAHWKIVANAFPSIKNLEFGPKSVAVQCSPWPKQQEPSAASPMPFAGYLKLTSFFSLWSLEKD